MYSVVLVLSDNLRQQGNELAEAMGYGPDNYSVPLSATGQEPATHYGLHTWASQAFVDILAADEMPAHLSQFAAVKAGVLASVRASSDGHFADVLAANNLQTVAPVEGESQSLFQSMISRVVGWFK